ncbi:hypothetical protein RchiOBHm_Chr6g0278921 [Rosa chinensis]|uniref:Uncharacterized protein n=1 Tax=Rosa chinensis TaxID=74649 RepID=A0A2P6PSV6_ROSCH|nr:uncharacterized protein LOC112173978 isoform X3 [Rosa chinensis]PRQ25019.1 hypothetical protein RchiOBHm_Chr6g0278921 [Rosa chinensis]
MYIVSKKKNKKHVYCGKPSVLIETRQANGVSRWLHPSKAQNSEPKFARAIQSDQVSRMAAVSQSVATCSGLINHPGHAKLPFGPNGTKITNHNAVSVTCRRTRRAGIRCLAVRRVGTTYAASVGKDHHQLSVDDGVPQEPFLLSLFKETVWSLRSLFIFLLEQPSQLKYIEWPGFRSTLKTATLTLVLVALLIVALSSTDSALSYMLALILRRRP